MEAIFATEDRLVAASLSRSRLQRLLSQKWLAPSDAGLLVSLLFLILGFKNNEAVQQVVAQFQPHLRNASRGSLRLVKEGATQISQGASQISERLRRGYASTPDLQRWRGDPSRSSSASADPSRSSSASALLRDQDASETQLCPRKNGLLHWLAGVMERRLDGCLITFLGYKLALLVLFTMPVSYFFGLKRKFLKWAARAAVFRLYLKVAAPMISVFLVASASVTVRLSKRALAPGTAQRWRMLALMNVVLTYCTSRLFELIRGDPTPMIELEETAQDRDLLAAEPPPLWYEEFTSRSMRKTCPPVFQNLDKLPQGGQRMLFVGNHCICGIDVPMLTYCLREKKGIWLRPLGEHSWFALPIVGELVHFAGIVDGTRHNCDLLMQQGQNLLVYPGGARESWKRTTDKKYELIWADHHLGFAAMAVRHGYTIVPVVSVGTEDVYEVTKDLPLDKITTLGGLLPSPRNGLSKAFDEGAKFPLIAGKYKKAQRNYFRIMEPIETEAYRGQEKDEGVLRWIRDETKSRLTRGIQEVLEYRESDPERFVHEEARRRAADRARGSPGRTSASAAAAVSKL